MLHLLLALGLLLGVLLLHLGLLPMLLLFTGLLLHLLLALLLLSGLLHLLLALGLLMGPLLLHLLHLGLPSLLLLAGLLHWLLWALLQGFLRHGSLHLWCLRRMAIMWGLRLHQGIAIGCARPAWSLAGALGKVRPPLRLCRQGA